MSNLYWRGALLLFLAFYAPPLTQAKDVFLWANGPFFPQAFQVSESLPLKDWHSIFGVDSDENLEFRFNGIQLDTSLSATDMDLDRNATIDIHLDAKFLNVSSTRMDYDTFIERVYLNGFREGDSFGNPEKTVVAVSPKNRMYVAQKIGRFVGRRRVFDIIVGSGYASDDLNPKEWKNAYCGKDGDGDLYIEMHK